MSYRQDILDDLSLTMALVDKNISGIDFSGEDFSNCAFSGVNFSNCNLQGVNFTSCQIANCDFSGADIEEDGNNIDVLLGPIRAEVSFFDDGSQNSIFISDEDSVKIDTSGDISLSSGWTKTDFVAGSNTPLKILPPSNQVISIAEWREELEKVYYQSTDTDDFTPGNRKIKIKLVYTDSALNEEIGIIKTIGSRNAVTVTPISWNNR